MKINILPPKATLPSCEQGEPFFLSKGGRPVELPPVASCRGRIAYVRIEQSAQGAVIETKGADTINQSPCLAIDPMKDVSLCLFAPSIGNDWVILSVVG